MSDDLYRDRRMVEDKIARLDRHVARYPWSEYFVSERQYWARVAMWIHARIERQEASDAK